MIYLCFDPGLSHTGVAISDDSKLARPLTTIHHQDIGKIVRQINLLLIDYKPKEIIIGQPNSGPIYLLSQQLYHKLKKTFSGGIHLYPEDLSSKIAQQKLVQSGVSKQTRRSRKHSAAAAVILQDYLDSKPLQRSLKWF